MACMPYGCKLSVNKCFLAKSPVGSLPFVHREISHCGEIQGSRADAKQMRGKRNSAGSTARDAGAGKPCSAHFILETIKGNSFLSNDHRSRISFASITPKIKSRAASALFLSPPCFSLPCVRGEQALSCLSGLPQRFCAAKALWDNFRAPAKIAWRVLREEERQAYQVMRQTKRAAAPNALPRRGVALAACELGNGTWSVPFQGSRADAKQMRGKRNSAGSTARDASAGKPCSAHFILETIKGNSFLSNDHRSRISFASITPKIKSRAASALFCRNAPISHRFVILFCPIVIEIYDNSCRQLLTNARKTPIL